MAGGISRGRYQGYRARQNQRTFLGDMIRRKNSFLFTQAYSPQVHFGVFKPPSKGSCGLLDLSYRNGCHSFVPVTKRSVAITLTTNRNYIVYKPRPRRPFEVPKIDQLVRWKTRRNWVRDRDRKRVSISIDGSYRDGKGGIGIAVREGDSIFLKGFSIYRCDLNTSGEVEASALLMALQFIHEMGFKNDNVTVEMDYLALFEFLYADRPYEGTMLSNYQKIMNACLRMIHTELRGYTFSVRHIFRERNYAADLLSKEARLQEISAIFFSIPGFMDETLFQDRTGIYNIR